MLESSLTVDPALATLVQALALLSLRPPHIETLARHADSAEVALDRFADGFERGVPDVALRAHTAYLAALVLAKTLSCFVGGDGSAAERITRFRRTATRLLDTLDRFVSSRDRALRASLLMDEQAGAAHQPIARA